jgi:hypothetical protein
LLEFDINMLYHFDNRTPQFAVVSFAHGRSIFPAAQQEQNGPTLSLLQTRFTV